ncbi:MULTISPECIES: aminotransferase class IV [Pseudomonas]|uniref:Branched-chain-amino-acid transaminase n=2 Tax=Pseudomonas syringae group TaxID=136849 RepID=A0A3M4IZ13_PSEVI|nr:MULTISPECIES: aminotransferase class IV [Pseudomonas]KTB70887.1 branched-chain amino acid aminotransferase [Pseudomonas sp. ICMP 3272]KTC52696.1 branched-chain amino acid aminotransferase [Pseudomonas syringae ICMP 19498]MDU8544895.1 aminotransferase class IV [Pseudomonas syringae group sp. J248-6]RMP00986.1 Branched-chain-amino-acid transaminase [Pseudomonas syringae pv. persicae]RMQ09371.1 Branched-chain-amino-acid transaminase [Pseudomonas viridiflava]
MTTTIAWLDGKYLEIDKVSFSPVTHSLSYASSVYEGMRSYGSSIFKCEEHLQRLQRSAQVFKHEVNYSNAMLAEACHELLRRNELVDAYIKIVVFYDDVDVSFMGRNCRSKVVIFVLPFAPKSATTPYRLTIANWRRAPAACHPYQAKTSSTYALSFLSFRDKGECFDDVLFLSTMDTVCESSGSNVFFVKENLLITPTTDMALAGITRQVVIDELSQLLNLQVVQRDISSLELNQFDGAFLCGTAMEITEVSCIDDVIYKKNSWVELLATAYKKMVMSASG